MRVQKGRAGRRSSGDGGAYWISYSDMMASLLLVFIMAVCLCIYQYYDLLETKTRELGEQQAELDAAQITLAEKEKDLETTRVELMGKEEEMAAIQIQLDARQAELYAAQLKLNEQAKENDELLVQIVLKETDLAEQQQKIQALQIVLAQQENELTAKEDELHNYQLRLEDILGVRTRIVRELSEALAANRISAKVDPNTGDIVLDSTLMFETNSSDLKPEGLTQLERLIPVYLGVLMHPDYRDFVAEIIIEGHTDSTGTYKRNLELSQERALGVAMYCLEMRTLSSEQKERLKDIITAQGRSNSNPIYDEYGVEDKQRSRRVEIKFRLKDAEMVQQMNSILSFME